MGNFHTVRKQLGGDNTEPWYVIHRGPKILGLCIRKDLNPRIDSTPAEVWVGDTADVSAWGVVLANHTEPIPLYAAEAKGDDYEPKGLHQVIPRKHTQAELEAARKQVPHGLSRIVFLQGPLNPKATPSRQSAPASGTPD